MVYISSGIGAIEKAVPSILMCGYRLIILLTIFLFSVLIKDTLNLRNFRPWNITLPSPAINNMQKADYEIFLKQIQFDKE